MRATCPALTPYRIDFHRHVIPGVYLEALDQAGVRDPLHGVAYPRWDADTDLGLMDRYGIRVILNHAGGTVPYLAKRFTYAATINPKLALPEPRDLLGSLRHLYYETAMSANPYTLAALAAFVSTGHILFGTDYPFLPESETADTIAGIGEFFDDDSVADIEQNNAAALVPRLAAIRA